MARQALSHGAAEVDSERALPPDPRARVGDAKTPARSTATTNPKPSLIPLEEKRACLMTTAPDPRRNRCNPLLDPPPLSL
jgi:hypothetical protein